MCIPMLLALTITMFGAPSPTNAELDAAMQWLRDHPCGVASRADRAPALDIIQHAADQLTPQAYQAYEAAWEADPTAADAAEREGVLYYLSSSEKRAIADIKATKVSEGAVVWLLYNAGYVVKTPDACFGIDVHCRRAAELAPELDFLLVTHGHGDHVSAPLMDAMVDAGKPVVSRFFGRGVVVTQPCERQFGPIRVKVDVGDHAAGDPARTNDMNMYQVECGESAHGFVFYHSGDGNNYAKMHPDRPIDAFAVHVRVGMSVDDAIAHLRPRVTLLSHVLELGHSPTPPNAWRWSFASAYESAPAQPEGGALLLTWGESWLAPDTELAH
jgi:L-ascorbate metabolism protein UlaG (beta-lactamase superfamily)